MTNLPRRHIETRRTERGLFRVVLLVIGAVLVVAVLAAEVSNPFVVIADQLRATTDNRRD